MEQKIDNSWTTKHRPHRLDDIIGNKEIIDQIKALMPNITHMLFRGPAGVGKTTTALTIIKELGCTFKEINASDENKVEDIRTIVKNFVITSSLDNKTKVILLDEADALTPAAQGALRRLMEKYSHNCKFIITCNFPEKLIDPIKSRCKGADFDFKPIQFNDFNIGITKILQKENMIIAPDAMLELYNQSRGDMRIVDKLYAISLITKNVTLNDILKIKDDDSAQKLYQLILENNYLSACRYIEKKHVLSIFDMIMKSNINDEKCKKIAYHFAEYDFRRTFAVTDYIQLYALIGNIIDVLHVKSQPIIIQETITANSMQKSKNPFK